MINLPVDEAYAFDFLSVIDVKRSKSSRDEDTFKELCSVIESQIGLDLFRTIMSSNIYSEMIMINQKIYDLIDIIRDEGTHIDAKVVDDANTERYRLKKRLQDQFFMSELAETKTKI